MSNFERLLKEADFSKETDLKQRLHDRLFSRNVVQFQSRKRELDDDILDMVRAAGPSNAEEQKNELEKLLKKDDKDIF